MAGCKHGVHDWTRWLRTGVTARQERRCRRCPAKQERVTPLALPRPF